MDMEDLVAGAIIGGLFIAIFIILCLADTIAADNKTEKEFKATAIHLGYAEYNRFNGNWQWKTNAVLEVK